MSKLNLSTDEEVRLNQMLLAAIPHPAMLVRIYDRVVLAANKVALDYGVKIGGQCWKELGKAEYLNPDQKEIAKNYYGNIPLELGIKCSFCQADDCFSQNPKQNNPNIEALGKIWDIYWIKITEEIFLHYIIDITEHKKREEELIIKNIILSTQLDTSLEGILVVDDEGNLISYNRRFSELWGLAEENLTATSDPDLLQRVINKIENKEAFLSRVNYLYAHKDESSYDEIKLTDGRSFERYSAPLLEPNRKYHGRVWYFTDATERKQNAETLRLSEEKYSTLIRYSNDPIFCFNPDETYRYVNDAFAKPFGKSPEEIIGKSPHSIFTYEEAEKRLSLIRNVLKTGEKGEIEVCVENKKTGDVKFFLTMADPVKDDMGNILWVSCISKDITERKLSETELRESEKLKNQLLQTTDQGIYGIDLDGFCTFINKSGLDILGYELKDCIGKNMHELIHHSYPDGSHYPVEECPILRSKETGESCKVLDDVLWRRDGTSFVAEYSSYPNIENRIIRGAVVTFTDITIRKNTEKALLDVIEKNPMSIQVVDKEGYIIKVNSAHTRLFGAVPPADYTIFDDFQVKQQGYSALFERVKAGEVVTFPDIFFNAHKLNPDFPDVPVWVRMVVFPINDSSGKPERFVTMHEDITERKQAEEKLKQQTNAMEAATVGIAILDINSEYVYLNNAHIKVYGYSNLDELIGKSWKNLYNSNELQRFEKKILPDLYLKGFWHGEAIGKKKDGSTFPQELSLTTLKNGELICIVRDITNRKLAEEALRESEEKYRIIIENIHDIIYTLTEEGIFLYASPAWTVMLGHSTEDVIGKHFRDFIHPDDVLICYKFLNKIKDSAQRQEGVEYRIKHINGSWRWHTSSGVPLKDNDGKISRLVGIARDITERKLVEETLQNEKQFSRSLLDSLPGIFYLYTYPEKKLVLWNKQHELILGYESYEMIDKYVYDWHRPEDKDAVTFAVDTVMEQGHSELEAILVTKDKKLIPFILTGVRFESHNEKYLMGIGIDMSDRKKAEEELQKSEARYRSILDASPDDITITDLEGSIQMISPKALTLFGYDKEEDIIGHNVIEFLIPSDRERAAAKVALMFKGVMTGPGEYQGLRSDGSIIYLEANGEFIKDAKGNPTNIVFVIRDVTDRKQMEATIVEKERLSAIGELASGIAHDFNNSLQAIVGNIELAFLSEDISEEIREYLKIIQSTTIDATARVRQLQRFARKEKESTFLLIDLNSLLDESIEQTRPKWKDETEKKGIKITIKKEYKAKGLIEGNIGELRSAFYNLVNNAIEAMPKGGTIKIQTEDSEKDMLIRIIDSGIGMDLEMTKRIFQPFFTTKGFELGRGLGLSSVYSVIRDHRGNVYVRDTSVGKGTTFEIMLPQVEPVNTEVATEKRAKTSTHIKAKILWVDDELVIRQLGKKLLTKLGHQAEIAEGGKEALKLLEESHFDLLITDVGMPGMSGWQLAESIKGKYNLKVAVVTGWGAEISEDEKLKCGIDYIIGKPINISELEELIDEALNDYK